MSARTKQTHARKKDHAALAASARRAAEKCRKAGKEGNARLFDRLANAHAEACPMTARKRASESMIIPDQVSALAAAFSRHLQRDLGSDIISVIRRNRRERDGAICHSHDFTDANMTMFAAFEEVMGRSPEVGGDTESSVKDIELWNAAWTAAKAVEFNVEVAS